MVEPRALSRGPEQQILRRRSRRHILKPIHPQNFANPARGIDTYREWDPGDQPGPQTRSKQNRRSGRVWGRRARAVGQWPAFSTRMGEETGVGRKARKTMSWYIHERGESLGWSLPPHQCDRMISHGVRTAGTRRHALEQTLTPEHVMS